MRLIITLVLAWAGALPVAAQGRQEGVGPGQRFFPVRDLQQDFLVYDEQAAVYIPFIPEQHSTQTAISAPVDLESNRRYKLLIQSQALGYLFIDAALRQRCEAGRWVVLNLDSLYTLYRKPRIFITLYGPKAGANWQLLLGHPRSASTINVPMAEDLLSVRPRSFSPFGNFFALGLLLLLTTHAFLYTYFRRAFQLFYNPATLLGFTSLDDFSILSRPLGRMSLAFTLNLSLLLAFLFMYVQHQKVYLFGSGGLLPEQQTLGWLLLSYGLVTLVLFILLIGKYMLIASVSSLYKFESLVNMHYIKVLHSTLLFTSGLVLIVASLHSSFPDWSGTSITYVYFLFISFYLARVVWLYLSFTRLLPVKNLYLFSYLCIVELIPLVVGIRLAS